MPTGRLWASPPVRGWTIRWRWSAAIDGVRRAPALAWLLLVPLVLVEGLIFTQLGRTGTDATLAAEGRRLFGARGCMACHQLDGVGQPLACDLSRVGRRRHKYWLQMWLLDPQGVRPGATMPNLGLSRRDALALAEYLARRQ